MLFTQIMILYAIYHDYSVLVLLSFELDEFWLHFITMATPRCIPFNKGDLLSYFLVEVLTNVLYDGLFNELLLAHLVVNELFHHFVVMIAIVLLNNLLILHKDQ